LKGSWARLAALGLIVLVLLLGGCSGGKGQKPAPPPVKVEAAPVRVATLNHTLTAVGSLASPQETIVTPRASGKVVALHIDQGQQVKEGEILARLDDSVQRAAVQQAAATLANARQIYARDRKVKGTGGVSEQQLQSDKAAVDQAKAQLEAARANLEHTIARAPFTGVLGLKQVSLGSYVEPPNPIVSIRQLDPLYLDFYLPQQEMKPAKLGQTVLFSVAGLDGRFQGPVTTVDRAVTPSSRTMHVQATVANPDQQLKPGMFVQVELVVGQTPSALFVPMQAIVPQGQLRTVWVVGPQQQVEKKRVTLGLYQENWVQVTSGLEPSAMVVTAGTQKLYPGARVVVSPYAPIHNQRLDLTKPAGKPPQ
jgi:RND family efflux transporter MFP subunit